MGEKGNAMIWSTLQALPFGAAYTKRGNTSLRFTIAVGARFNLLWMLQLHERRASKLCLLMDPTSFTITTAATLMAMEIIAALPILCDDRGQAAAQATDDRNDSSFVACVLLVIVRCMFTQCCSREIQLAQARH